MTIARRELMRRALFGTGAVLTLPFLDYFLDENGEAVAATGQPLPTRFGTFFWGCGLQKQLWVPPTVGPGYEIMPQLKPLEFIKDKMNVYSGFRAITDSRPNIMHFTGQASILTGAAPPDQGVFEGETIDVTVSKAIGAGSRFRSIEATPSGDPRVTMSSTGGINMNTPEATALGLYSKLFGSGYQDPRNGEWKPDAKLLLEKSVLSVVSDERKKLLREVGAHDRERLDQYFTSVRQTEQQLDAQLTRPAVTDACVVPPRPEEMPANNAVPRVMQNMELMSNMLALAMACNQTKVVSVFLSKGASGIFNPGDPAAFHQHTHEEPDDADLGYQVTAAKFGLTSMEAFAMLLKAMENIKEGDKTLLDRSLVLAYTDTSYAKIHAIDGIPMFIAGGANGRFKTGQHYSAPGGPVSRVGLTIQHALGIEVPSWGQAGLETSKPISEVLV
jgi:hypothetical protein